MKSSSKKEFSVYRSVYFDDSTKGFRHGISHKRHDCWRGDVRTFQLIDGKRCQIARVRKRFTTKDDAMRWAVGIAYNIREYFKHKLERDIANNSLTFAVLTQAEQQG